MPEVPSEAKKHKHRIVVMGHAIFVKARSVTDCSVYDVSCQEGLMNAPSLIPVLKEKAVKIGRFTGFLIHEPPSLKLEEGFEDADTLFLEIAPE